MSEVPSKHRHLLRQFSRYFLVAGLGYLVDIGTLFILHDFFGVHYLVAAALGFTFGLIITYIMSSLFVFGESKLTSKTAEIGLFAIIGIGGLGILAVLMWLLVDMLGLNYLLAKILATIVVYAWNFFARRSLYHN